MIKRITLILLSTIFLMGFVAFAEGTPSSAEIISPKSGEKVGADFSEIIFTAKEGASVSLRLDGEEIFYGVSEGENKLALQNKLLLGTHTLSLKALSDTGVESDSVTFICEDKKTEIIDSIPFNDFGVYEAGVDKDGNKVYATPAKFEGKDGEADGAVGYQILNLDGRIITKGSLAHDFKLSDYKEKMIDKVALSFDLKISNAYYFEFEMKNGDGGWINPGGKMLFKNDYTIAATGKSYPNNEWMAVEIVFDVPKQTISVFIDGENIIPEYKAEAHLRGLQMLRFLHCPRPGAEEQSYAVDNFKMTLENRFAGFNEEQYKIGDIFEGSIGGEITEPFNEIRFKTDMALGAFYGDFSAKCFADGREVKVSKVTSESVLNEDAGIYENYVTITLDKTLYGDSKVQFLIENMVSETEKVIFKNDVLLKTGNVGIDSIEFLAGEKECISASALKENDKFEAKFNIRNFEEGVVCVVGIYDGNKLLALSCKKAESAACSVETTIPAAENGYTVQCFMIDGYKGRKALSGSYTIE